MKKTVILGKVSIVPKDEWSATVTYERLDIVSREGSTYIVKIKCTNIEPGVTDGWEKYYMAFSTSGKSALVQTNIWVTATELSAGELVIAKDEISFNHTPEQGENFLLLKEGKTNSIVQICTASIVEVDEDSYTVNLSDIVSISGNGIEDIALTEEGETVDTYTITLTSGKTYTFEVPSVSAGSAAIKAANEAAEKANEAAETVVTLSDAVAKKLDPSTYETVDLTTAQADEATVIVALNDSIAKVKLSDIVSLIDSKVTTSETLNEEAEIGTYQYVLVS